jgi:hypothetical protein
MAPRAGKNDLGAENVSGTLYARCEYGTIEIPVDDYGLITWTPPIVDALRLVGRPRIYAERRLHLAGWRLTWRPT